MEADVRNEINRRIQVLSKSGKTFEDHAEYKDSEKDAEDARIIIQVVTPLCRTFSHQDSWPIQHACALFTGQGPSSHGCGSARRAIRGVQVHFTPPERAAVPPVFQSALIFCCVHTDPLPSRGGTGWHPCRASGTYRGTDVPTCTQMVLSQCFRMAGRHSAGVALFTQGSEVVCLFQQQKKYEQQKDSVVSGPSP